MQPSAWIHTGYAQRLHFGPGALNRVAEVVRELGARRVLLVTTEGRLASDDGQRLQRLLGRALAGTFSGVRSHLPTGVVQEALLESRATDADGIVSFGGGSAMDLGKAVGFFAEREASSPGVSYADRPLLPHVAIPTTYSGAELTPFFGMTDERTRTKQGAGGPTSAPIAVIYDPELTFDLPPRTTAETGMNALAHCVEAAYATDRTPEAEAVALAGARLVAGALPLVVDEPGDPDLRSLLLQGSALAGRALQNAAMGVHHGLAQLVGGRTGLPHGLANAVILPHAMRFNATAVPNELTRIGAAIGDEDDPSGAVERLLERLDLPTRLGDLGVTDEDLDAVARLSQGNANVRRNPRPVSEDDARMILEAAH